MDFNNGYGGASSRFAFDNDCVFDEPDEEPKEGKKE